MIRHLLELLDREDDRPRLARGREPSLRATPQKWSRRELLFPFRAKVASDARWCVSIDAERCSDCAACVRVCHADALHRCQVRAEVIYRTETRRCDGCGDCERVCAENALRIAGTEHPAEVIVVARLARAPCSQCGRQQAGLLDGCCFVCRSTQTRIGAEGSRPR